MIHCAHLIYVAIIEYIMKSLLYFQIISYNICFFNVNIDSTLNVIAGKTLMHLHIRMSESINNWLRDVTATKVFVSCVQLTNYQLSNGTVVYAADEGLHDRNVLQQHCWLILLHFFSQWIHRWMYQKQNGIFCIWKHCIVLTYIYT